MTFCNVYKNKKKLRSSPYCTKKNYFLCFKHVFKIKSKSEEKTFFIIVEI